MAPPYKHGMSVKGIRAENIPREFTAIKLKARTCLNRPLPEKQKRGEFLTKGSGSVPESLSETESFFLLFWGKMTMVHFSYKTKLFSQRIRK